jgi:hypothetical protein
MTRRRAALHTRFSPRAGSMTGPPPNNQLPLLTRPILTPPQARLMSALALALALAQPVRHPHPRVPLRLAPSRSATPAARPTASSSQTDRRPWYAAANASHRSPGPWGSPCSFAAYDDGHLLGKQAWHGDTRLQAVARPSFLRASARASYYHAVRLCDGRAPRARALILRGDAMRCERPDEARWRRCGQAGSERVDCRVARGVQCALNRLPAQRRRAASSKEHVYCLVQG